MANGVGSAILAALQAKSIAKVIERINATPTFGSQIETGFRIPISPPSGVGSVDNSVAFCMIPGSCNSQSQFQNPNGPVMYAKLTPTSSSTPIPTPALLPGLIGMGAAILRKRQQAASEG